ncbi:MAG: hypothetical protein CL477_13180 [Acidobacteria bacterium]|nr:hypothetical protein [Acidobacteriota bacterium]MBQ01627.1 hypothetical protein [Acidobacteriota bacterium]MDP7690585.1 tetratricopeptide repeat protein [Vicinamibacterales bacterium]
MNRTETIPLLASLVLAAGLMGWIVWSQRPAEPVEAIASSSSPLPPAPVPPAPEPPPLDETRAAQLRETAEGAPDDVQVRVDLGNLYFNSQQFEDAIPWFEEALTLDPKAVDVSTDLAVAYFYLDDTERALAQLARSLEVDPAHAKTILSLGIVRAFGNQDLDGAFEAWEEVLRVAPGSPEALAAADAMERLRAAH